MLPRVDALARLITDALAARGWTQAELSRRSGVALTTINSWVKGSRGGGNRGPNPDKLRAVADALGIDVVTVLEAAGRYVPPEDDEDDEREFLNAYRSLTKDGKALTLANMRAYIATHGNKRNR